MTKQTEQLLLTTLQELERLTEGVARRIDALEGRVAKIEAKIDSLEKTMVCLEQTEAQKALSREKEIKTAIIRTIGGAVGGGIVFLAMKMASVF